MARPIEVQVSQGVVFGSLALSLANFSKFSMKMLVSVSLMSLTK